MPPAPLIDMQAMQEAAQTACSLLRTIANENRESLMLSIAKSFLMFNSVDSLETTYKKIDAISASDLMAIANEIFSPELLSSLIYKQSWWI